MISKTRHERTVKDLVRLTELTDQISALYKEMKLIKSSCPCHDLEPKIVETLAYEYTPRGVCIVCGSEKDNLTLEQKIACFKDYFPEDEDGPRYTDEEFLKMAQDGGFNLPDPDFYLRNADALN